MKSFSEVFTKTHAYLSIISFLTLSLFLFIIGEISNLIVFGKFWTF